MGRHASTFRRGESRLVQQPTVLVICEDTKSGKQYLNDAKIYYRANAVIEIVNVGHTDPKGIVTKAIERQGKYDIIFCVIDRDTHPTFDEALILAKQSKKIQLIVSYPCFEYWLFLHFQYSRRGYAPAGAVSPGQQMVRALREQDGMKDYDKGANTNLFEILLGRLEVAKNNALKAEMEAVAVGDPNPSTRIYYLLESFEALGRPKEK